MTTIEPLLHPTEAPGYPVWACIICFHAQAASLKPLVDALRDQVDKILLLDNSSEAEGGIATLANEQVIYLPMPSNRGTAGAMNQAWQLALAEGATAMFSFDQDSMPAAGMVVQLTSSLTGLQRGGMRPAAIGPGKIDPRNSKSFLIPQPFSPGYRPPPSAFGSTVEVGYLITSGSLIPAEMYQAVGPFREELFLDYVDIEWSLRARSLGYSLYTDPRTTMAHTIGDTVIQIGSRSLSVHKPYRCYLLVRNHLLLWRLPSTPLYWLLRDLRQVTLKMMLLLALRPHRLERLCWISKGVWHGLHKRGGSPF